MVPARSAAGPVSAGVPFVRAKGISSCARRFGKAEMTGNSGRGVKVDHFGTELIGPNLALDQAADTIQALSFFGLGKRRL
jgi:hypothetical protein